MNYDDFLLEIESKCAGKKKLQIDNFTNYCTAVGNPEQKLNAVHIGGTNGKGSTAAMVESILHAHGFSTGLNTSPHLVHYKERFRINKQELPKAKILDTYLRFRDKHRQYKTSYFEISTALAFQLFYEAEVDYSIIEVGMGGRLDATKLVNSQISAITSIDYDHMKSLGNTLAKIAWQKAGIIKANRPIILGKLPAMAHQTIVAEAKKKKAPVINSSDKVTLKNQRLTDQGNYVDLIFTDYDFSVKNLFCNLVGIHQLDNMVTAIAICLELAIRDHWNLDEEKMRQGLATVRWQGRLETISENPKIIIDGAHNPAGIKKLVYNLANIYNYEKLICVLAIFFDKDFPLMIRNLSHVVDTFIVTRSKSERASATGNLAREAKQYNQVMTENSVEKALEKARSLAGDKDLICVTGSLYTLKEIKENLT